MSNALTIITGTIQEAREAFASVLTDRALSFEREAGFAVQILSNSEFAMKIAVSNRQSVIDAVTNIAAIGISLNPAKKQAYLVPRDSRICLDISYMGLLDIAIQSGSIRWGQAELVRESDGFVLNGFDKPPTHTRNPFGRDRGDLVGTYVVVKTADGDYLTTTMEIDEVYAIRDRSSAWKAWLLNKKKCPWVTDEGEMVKKTVIKRAYKTWPKTDRLDRAIHHLNTDGGEGLAFDNEPAAVPSQVDVIPLIAAVQQTRTDAEALKFWKDHNARLAKQPADHERLKQSIVAHRTKLREEAANTVDMPPTTEAAEADEQQEQAQ